MFNTNNLQSIASSLVNEGFTIFYNESPRKMTYFTYMYENKFGYIQEEYEGCYHISSSYKPSKNAGTGCNYKNRIINPTLDDFKKSLNFHFNNLSPVFFENIQDYLINHFQVFTLKIKNNQGIKKSLDYLEGYYIFKSDKHAPVIKKNHTYLFKNFYERSNDTFKAIFTVNENSNIEVLNHNINLFEDNKIMQGFKNRILNQDLKVYKCKFDAVRLKAIGYRENFENIQVSAVSENDAKLKLYDNYEHIMNFSCSEI